MASHLIRIFKNTSLYIDEKKFVLLRNVRTNKEVVLSPDEGDNFLSDLMFESSKGDYIENFIEERYREYEHQS